MQHTNLRAKDVDGDLHYFSIYQIRSGPDETGVYYVAINDALIPIVAGTEQWAVGFKDKNDREIYVGDIPRDPTGIGEIEWVQEHCAYMVFTKNPSKYHRLESDGKLFHTEVIGNIYENPELIEV